MEEDKFQDDKILNFNAMVGNNNYNIAIEFLDLANWDESEAARLYLDNVNVPDIQIKPNNQFKYIKECYIEPEDKKLKIISFFKTAFKRDNSKLCYEFYGKIRGLVTSGNNFINLLKINKGVIILYNLATKHKLFEQLDMINRDQPNDYLNCSIIYPVINDSAEGSTLIEQLAINRFPCYLFCKYKNEKIFYVVDKMEGIFYLDLFKSSLSPEVRIPFNSNINLQQNSNNNNNISNISNNQKNYNSCINLNNNPKLSNEKPNFSVNKNDIENDIKNDIKNSQSNINYSNNNPENKNLNNFQNNNNENHLKNNNIDFIKFNSNIYGNVNGNNNNNNNDKDNDNNNDKDNDNNNDKDNDNNNDKDIVNDKDNGNDNVNGNSKNNDKDKDNDKDIVNENVNGNNNNNDNDKDNVNGNNNNNDKDIANDNNIDNGNNIEDDNDNNLYIPDENNNNNYPSLNEKENSDLPLPLNVYKFHYNDNILQNKSINSNYDRINSFQSYNSNISNKSANNKKNFISRSNNVNNISISQKINNIKQLNNNDKNKINININSNINKKEEKKEKKEYIPNYEDYAFEDELVYNPVLDKYEKMSNVIQNLDKNDNNKNNKFVNRDIPMSDKEIRKNQDEEMRELERIEEEKQKKIKEEMEKKKKEEEEEKERLKNEAEEKELFSSLVPPEPDDRNPDKCVIIFRMPDGEKNLQRKFLKTEKISVLYDYVKSLGKEIYSDEEYQNFSIIQTFPLKDFEDKLNSTLEEEGLFPNSILQIKLTN